ncbi:MAG: hypothetical protein IKU27_05780 [Clostridia bacterium]|nr:hypothetical protein [Clostridia bacterium]MBR5284540.1 hypothetical protein [Clostridia bacterium]
MYNRYINAEGFIPKQEADPSRQEHKQENSRHFQNCVPPPGQGSQGARSPLHALLGDRFKLPDLSQENLLLLVLVYFLVTDEGDKPGDILLLIAALFLLGL